MLSEKSYKTSFSSLVCLFVRIDRIVKYSGRRRCSPFFFPHDERLVSTKLSECPLMVIFDIPATYTYFCKPEYLMLSNTGRLQVVTFPTFSAHAGLSNFAAILLPLLKIM